MGQILLLSPPEEGMLRIFTPVKIQRLRPGLNQRNLGASGQHANYYNTEAVNEMCNFS